MSYETQSKKNRKTLKQLLAEAEVVIQEEPDNLTVELKRTDADTVPITELRPCATPIPKDITVDAGHKILSDLPAFRDIQALLVGKTKQAWKHNYPRKNTSYDKVCFAHLYKAYRDAKGEKRAKYLSYLKYVQKFVCADGTLQGLCARLESGLPKTEPLMKQKEYMMQFVADLLYFRPDKIPNDIDWDDGDIFNIVEQADAGLPYMMTDPENSKCTGTTLASAVNLAKMYCKLLMDGDDSLSVIRRYFLDHPAEFRFMMKRKHERMPFRNVEVKNRPYYVPPLALKLIFIWVAHFVQSALLNYTEFEPSISAYKTSWFYGGTTKFVESIIEKTVRTAKEDGMFVFRSVCYGDDNYWVFAFPDGSFVIVAPDASAMDMNVASVCGPMLQEIFEKYYEKDYGEKPPKLFRRAMKLLMIVAFKTNVHVFGSYGMAMLWGLRSGIPLTTILDMVCSGCVQGNVEHLAQQHFAKTKGVSDENFDVVFDEFTRQYERRVYVETSIKFKRETLRHIKYNNFEDVTEFRLPFLGYRFEKVTREIILSAKKITVKGWLPVPDELEKRVVSYIMPMRAEKNVQANYEYILERIYGIVLSGGFVDKDLYAMLKSHYSVIHKAGASPQQTTSLPPGFEEVEELMEVHPDLPSRDTIFAMFLMSREEFGLQVLGRQSDGESEEKIVEYTSIESLDMKDVMDASSMFAAVAIGKRHAGKAVLPPTREEAAKRLAERAAEQAKKAVFKKFNKKKSKLTSGGSKHDKIDDIFGEEAKFDQTENDDYEEERDAIGAGYVSDDQEED